MDRPPFVFANVYDKVPKSESASQAEPADMFAFSSMSHTATPDDLHLAGAKATDLRGSLIDDFSHDWQDWYLFSVDNPDPWEYSTRKLSDPQWQGQPDQQVSLEA